MKKKKQKTINSSKVKQTCDHIKQEIGKIVVGYDSVIEDFLVCLITQSHMFMIGIPGIAKTTLAKTFAQVTGLSWNRVQFTQDLLPSDIIGHYYFNQKTSEFELRKGPVFSEILLADEINRAPPKTQSALIESMQERQVTIEGTTLQLPWPFMVIATKNPVETEGVYPLPEAQLDRFLYRVDMDYLEHDLELELLKRKSAHEEPPIETLKPTDIHHIVGLHHHVYIEEAVLSYILKIIDETRNTEKVVLGASPRAGEHLLFASKAYALIHGRDYVIPDDVKTVAPKVLCHRLLLSAEAELEGLSTQKVLDDLLASIEIPEIMEATVKTR